MLELAAPADLSTSTLPDGPAPSTVLVRDASGAETGELLVWVKDGRLSGLEFAWWTDEPPTRLPTREEVTVTAQ